MSIGGISESWARLRLVQGDSAAPAWELVASPEPTTLTVGSSSDCSWVVHGPGVQPTHFSLHWDGTALRIADTQGHGDVRLDGTAVGHQWQSVIGHARIDFGQAAMMVDTSANAGRSSESGHPLDPGSVPPASSEPGAESGAWRRIRKGTLLGVSPMSRGLAGASSEVSSASRELAGAPSQAPSRSVETGAAASNIAESERMRKATLLGVAVNFPAQASLAAGDAPGQAAQGEGSSGVGQPELSGPRTLLANDPADKRTLLGMPLEHVMGLPPRSEAHVAGPVARAEVRAVSAAPGPVDQAERIASAWHEVPSRGQPESVPMAVLVGREGQGARAAGANHDARPTPILDPRPGRRGFPFHYLGIVALTAAAYFAWLYLLDHL